LAATVPEGFAQLFDDPRALAFVATTMPDGSPQVTPVWIEAQDDAILFNTAEGRVKWQNLRRDPRVAIAVVDPKNLYRYVQVRGVAEMSHEGADRHIDSLAKKYLGTDTYTRRSPDEVRVKVTVRPRSVQTMG
jgi:PPOX class probable F420-dependent enzyme